ncbi:MAG: TetR/AcrR family transcriptional regulator [Pseudomonadota bacterium]
MNNKNSTKDKILDAAETLFAERGFAETSLRMITSRADVNLASVNYHFGSKKALIQAVFDRFFQHLSTGFNSRFEQLEKQEIPPKVEEVIAALLGPILDIDNVRTHGTSIFMRLLGRAYAETQGHLRRFMLEKYGYLLSRFNKQIHRAYPTLPMEQLFWRLHFMLGSMVFTLAGSQALQEIAEADFKEVVDTKALAGKLINFLAAGMKA